MSKTGSRIPAGRQRQLNIVYFIDASKTRSLRIPLGRLKLILAGCGVVVLWAVFSIVLVVHGAMKRDAMGDSMKTLLAALFEYQTRYDSVFEMAYPDKPGTIVSSAAVQMPPKESADVASGMNASVPEPTVAASSASATTQAGQPAGPTVQAAAVAPGSGSPDKGVPAGGAGGFGIKVERIAAEVTDSQLSLTVDLRNKDNPNKAEGSIYIAAQVLYADGKTVWIAWPSGVQIKADGTAGQPQSATKYSIRNFKSQQVTLEIPSRSAGKIGEIRVTLHSKDGTESTQTAQIGKDFAVRSGKAGQ